MINDTIINDVANHICDAYDNLLAKFNEITSTAKHGLMCMHLIK